ncbi:MAG: hypothetical protein ACTSX4_04045 [Candidatus Helarchaeota archaeon]
MRSLNNQKRKIFLAIFILFGLVYRMNFISNLSNDFKFSQSSEDNLKNTPNVASEWTPGLDFTVYTEWEDYYDYDYLNGRDYKFDVIIQDKFGDPLLSSDPIYFWISPADNQEGTEIMNKIQAGSYSYSSINTWFIPGQYSGDTEIIFFGNGWWEFKVDSTIMDDYIGERITFDVTCFDDSTGEVERFSNEVHWHYLSNVGPSTILLDPNPGELFTTNTVNVDWEHPIDYQESFSSFDGFEVWLDSGTHYTRSSDPTDSDYTFSGVSEGSHTAYVRAISSSAYGATESVSFTVDTIPPSSPTSLIAPAVDEWITSIPYLFQWSSVGDAASYNIEITGPTNIITNIGTNSYLANGLTEGNYSWRVQSIDSAGNIGTWSNSQSFSVDYTVPIPPTSLIAPVAGGWVASSSFIFQWSSVGDAASYNIEITGPTNINTNIGTNSYFTSGLAEGSYTWRVQSIDSAGNIGTWSTTQPFSVDVTAPKFPTSLIAPVAGGWVASSSFTFQWSSVGDAASYNIEITGPTNINSNIGTNSCSATGLTEGNYTWRVQSIDLAGNIGAWSNSQSFSVDYTAPIPPASLTAPSDGDLINTTYMTFQWSSIGDAASYNIEITGPTNININIGTNSYSATGLLEGNYTWRVQSIDSAGNIGAWSNSSSFSIDLPTTSNTSTMNNNLENSRNQFWDNLIQNGLLIPFSGAIIAGLVGLVFWRYKKKH